LLNTGSQYNGSVDVASNGVQITTPAGGQYSTLTSTSSFLSVSPTFNPTLSSTATDIAEIIQPVVNFAGGGAGNTTALLINPTYTAAPTGKNLLLDLQSGGADELNVNSSGVVSIVGGQTADVTSLVASGAGAGLTIKPGTSTGASSNGGGSTVSGGDASGTTSVTGGSLTLVGGSATGGSGTRNGGSVSIDVGTGATANGGINIGIGAHTDTIQIGDASTSNTGNTQTINIGNLNAAGTTNVTLGSLNGGSATAGSTTVQAFGAVAINSGSASTYQTGAGNIILQPAGSGTTATVQIGAGNGGAGSTTPDLLALDVSSSASDPTEINGAMYYNANMGRFRCGVTGAWESCLGGLIATSTGRSPKTTCGTGGTACTAFGTIAAIPANYLVAGRIITITMRGVYSSTGTPNLSLGVYFGASSTSSASDTLIGIASSNTFATPSGAANDGWELNYQINCYTTGGSGTIVGEGKVVWQTGTLAQTPSFMNSTGTTTTTIDTTSSTNIYVFPLFSAASASNKIETVTATISGE